MFTFSEKFNSALCRYKQILSRYLDKVAKKAVINQHNLGRVALRNISEVQLYEKAQGILSDLEYRLTEQGQPLRYYSSIRRLHRYLKGVLEEYTVYNGQVIHCRQVASRAMVQIVQIIKKEGNQLSEKEKSILKTSIYWVDKFGSKEEKRQINTFLVEKKWGSVLKDSCNV